MKSVLRLSAAALALVLAACGTGTTPAPPPAPMTIAPPAPVAAPPQKAATLPGKAATPPPAKSVAAKPQAPAPAKAPAPPAPAPLDLKSLEDRLKDTHAIGVLTKLSLKNQVDDLIAKFRAYHQGERPPTLPELRPAFDLLLMKVLSLLQDSDPALAHDINASRDAIWGVLADKRKLDQFT